MSKAIRMVEHVDGGWFEGDPPVWADFPKKGETAVLDDSNADNLVARGAAEYVTGKAAAKAETATTTGGAPETRAPRGGARA